MTSCAFGSTNDKIGLYVKGEIVTIAFVAGGIVAAGIGPASNIARGAR
jgi:hypothetical protein